MRRLVGAFPESCQHTLLTRKVATNKKSGDQSPHSIFRTSVLECADLVSALVCADLSALFRNPVSTLFSQEKWRLTRKAATSRRTSYFALPFWSALTLSALWYAPTCRRFSGILSAHSSHKKSGD